MITYFTQNTWRILLRLSCFSLVLSILNSCIEHEVIPAPIPKADLSCHFSGTVNGTFIELTENVQGYKMSPSKSTLLNPSPQLSSVKYYSEMNSLENAISVRVGLGSISWDDAGNAGVPPLNSFNSFFTTNTTPAYSDGCSAGFEISYRDASGGIWVSKQNSVNAQNVTFSAINQESDSNGDYSKFICEFNCYVYRINPQTSALDSLRIQNGILKGWFDRKK